MEIQGGDHSESPLAERLPTSPLHMIPMFTMRITMVQCLYRDAYTYIFYSKPNWNIMNI